MDLAQRIVEAAEALQRNALLEQACTVRVSIGEEAQYNVSVVPMGQLVQLEYQAGLEGALVWKVPRNESKAFEEVWGFIGEAMLEHARAFNAEQARRKQQVQVPAGSVAHSIPRQEPAPADSEQHAGQAADGDSGSNGGDSDSANGANGDADTSDSDGDFELSFLLEDDDDDDDYASHHSLAEIWPQRFTIELIKRGKTFHETSAFSMDLSEHLIQRTKMLRYLY